MAERGGIRVGVTVQTVQNAGAVFSGLGDLLRRAARDAGEACAAEARRLAPVKTGRLRDSIGCTVAEGDNGSVQAVVGTNVPYAAAQELGTAKRPGRHFLENGMAAAGSVFSR